MPISVVVQSFSGQYGYTGQGGNCALANFPSRMIIFYYHPLFKQTITARLNDGDEGTYHHQLLSMTDVGHLRKREHVRGELAVLLPIS